VTIRPKRAAIPIIYDGPCGDIFLSVLIGAFGRGPPGGVEASVWKFKPKIVVRWKVAFS